MATIAAGNHVEVYVPLAGDITITPGTGGYVEFGCSSPSGESAPEGRRLYAAAAIAIPAGSTMFLRAEGEDATYTDPATGGGVVTAYTASQLSALAAAGGLTPYATYVESDTGVAQFATSASTYVPLINASLYATLALTATSSGKRQALGSTRQVRFTAGGAGSVYVKFTNASAAITVSSSDTAVDCNASSAVTLNVPSGYAFLEYLRVGGSDVNFNLGLMV